jgi:hypothetical protein
VEGEDAAVIVTIGAVERFAIDRGFNAIECDRCGIIQALDRTPFRSDALDEARSRGWRCDADPAAHYCPECKL